MKKTHILLFGTALLCACNMPVDQSDAAKALRAAQETEGKKGNVTYDIEGSAQIGRSQDKETLSDITLGSLTGQVTFREVPPSLADFDFGFLKHMAFNAHVSASSLTVNVHPSRDDTTQFSLVNAVADFGIVDNVAYIDMDTTKISGGEFQGVPINVNTTGLWSITPFFDEDNPLGFDFTEYLFNTFVSTLFEFTNQGGISQASMKLDYNKVSDLYTAINLAVWMEKNGYSVGPNIINNNDDTIVRMRNLYRSQVEEIISEDFRFELTFRYTDAGIASLYTGIKGVLYPNALVVDDDRDIQAVSLDVALTLRAAQNQGHYQDPSNGNHTEMRGNRH